MEVSGHPICGRNSAQYSLSTVLLPDRMWWHGQGSHKSRQLPGVRLQGEPEFGTGIGGQWRKQLCEVQPDQVDNLLSLMAELRENRRVKNYQGLRVGDWIVGPFPSIPENRHHPAASPEGRNPLPSLPLAWRTGPKGQVSKGSLGGTKTQWIRFLFRIAGELPLSH